MANTDKPAPESPHDGPASVTLSRPQSPSLPSVADHPSAPPSSANGSPFAIPHPKRFNAVNINKKFLQKNASPSAPVSVAASLASTTKAGSPAPVRPAPQLSASHSKLVTTKLTSSAQLSPVTAPGWSRPSSATPPVTTPSGSSNAPPPQPSTPAAPHFPHAGKVIQPQPRNAVASSSPLVKKDTSTRPAWGNPKSLPAASDSNNTPYTDFPTAAEVAQGQLLVGCQDRLQTDSSRSSPSRAPKTEGPKPEDPLAPRRAPLQEADAFRGVHLDPNAHHWDEMEEDDDNFLANVIEFGDGRQYNIAPSVTAGQLPLASTTPPSEETPITITDHSSTEPVSKEERFADDFDRSWPRTRQSPLVLQRDLSGRSSQHVSHPPTPSHLGHPSAEGSRVLFNERSNRLEPYTNSNFPNRLGSGPGFSRRGAHGEPALSPAELRFNRDAPPHSPVHPVHLLQKPSDVTHNTLLQLPRSHPGDFMGRRVSERDIGPHAPGGEYSHKVKGRDFSGSSGLVSEERHRRLSGASFASSIPDGQQQGSSHSSDVPFSRRSQARESPLQPLSVLPASMSAQVSRASQMPATSHITTSEAQLSGTSSALDIEGVHKAAMHISAERARQRRQLEEEEREKEKERARRKAAELEARMAEVQKVTPVETVQQVDTHAPALNQLIADVEKHESPDSVHGSANETFLSLKSPARSLREASHLTTIADEQLPPSEQADSWRSKTRPQPQQLPALSFPLFQEPPDVVADDNLEVIDFSDLGKFVGGEQVPLATEAPAPSSHPPTPSDRYSFPPRPVASNFFEGAPSNASSPKLTPPTSERNPPLVVSEAPSLLLNEQIQPTSSSVPAAPTQTREYELHKYSGPNGSLSVTRSQPSSTAPHHRPSKGSAPFRQARMSALDDVMSRIKGALDDMQVDAGRGTLSSETMDWRVGTAKPKVRVVEPPISARTLSKDSKWLPPALRQFQQESGREAFSTTGCEPPRSPRPVSPVVKLPAISRPVDTISRRQLQLLKISSAHVRFDALSWDPPIEGANKRDLSLNEILFRRPPLGKGNKIRYKVQLPRVSRAHPASLPKVNLPSGFPKSNMTAGRSKAVDDLLTWRRGPAPSATRKTVSPEETPPILDVTSCSPAPEVTVLPPKPVIAQEVPSKSEAYLVRQRTQPKLPAGRAVGFYRDPGSSVQDTKAAVNFTVTSELEEVVQVAQLESSMLLSSSIAEASPATALPESEGSIAITDSSVDEADYDLQLPSLSLITQADSKASEESTERSLRTPASASFSAPWTKSPLSFSSKDSPARPPDPEHLRAVWSQTADKEPMSAVNSLEGIADDLTALPFTIQEVKSEDGETPPPSSAAVASKISLHDVTRAFQQVPASSNLSSNRPSSLSPTAVNGPITRPATFAYPTPPQAPSTAVRPHFAAFSSPMLAHSPSPTVLYPPPAPSPIPRVPMNGHPQLYNQPMWVPMQTSQSNGTVRPIPSPYPAQMVAYPAPGPVHPVYASGLSPQNVPPSVNGSGPPRPRGMPMLSPVMHPAAPANVSMYNSSPVLIHPPAMIASGHRPPYMNSGPPERGQGQGRPEGMPAAPHMQQPSHSSHIHPHPVYTHVPFSRPSW